MKKITKTLFLFLLACISTATQTIAQTNYMAGWDANSATDKTPHDAGWRTTAGDVAWADSDPIKASNYQYRDNLSVGRVFIHPLNNSIFSYPLATLKANTFYQFTCSSAKMSGNGTRATTFSINTTEDGNGSELGSDTQGAKKWDTYTNHSFRFTPSTAGNYYLLWQTHAGGDGDRSLAWGFKVVELGAALTVTFNTNEGSTVEPQYLLSGASEKATKPVDPTREGYIFKGWYADSSLGTEYDFSSAVEADITIYAGWTDTKEELKALVTTATGLVAEGTEAGKAYLNTAISTANVVVNNADATTEEITEAFNNLTDAIAVYRDTSLSALLVDGTAIAGFSATAYQYSYSLAPAITNVPTVTANAIATCAACVIVPASQLPGNTTVTVTAGNGQTQTYTIAFIINYMAGWDANGAEDKTPGDAGWLNASSAEWQILDTDKHCYRDNIKYDSFSGRTLTTDYLNSVYAYPVELTGGKTYQFTARFGAINGGVNPASFNMDINTTATREEGVSLASRTYSIRQTTMNTYTTASFFVPATGTYYFTFQGTTSCRGLLANLTLVELPITAASLATFSNDALIQVQELTLEGDFTAADINTLNTKLGANAVLTSVDLTNATIADDATDIFATLNPNALKYFAEGAAVPANWTNAVLGNAAANIELTDGSSFNNTKEFTATAIAYKRTFAQGWSTFSLPFSIADVENLGTIEKFTEVKEATKTIAFETATEIVACDPYLINLTVQGEKTFSASNAIVPVTVPATGVFNATFNVLTGSKAAGKLILVDEGEAQEFQKANAEATIPAFRAYISLEAGAQRSYAIAHNGGTTTDMENAATNGQELAIYSTDRGIVVNAATNQQVAVRSIDGRLLQIRSVNAGESVTISNLATGIYLINNQTAIVT